MKNTYIYNSMDILNNAALDDLWNIENELSSKSELSDEKKSLLDTIKAFNNSSIGAAYNLAYVEQYTDVITIKDYLIMECAALICSDNQIEKYEKEINSEDGGAMLDDLKIGIGARMFEACERYAKRIFSSICPCNLCTDAVTLTTYIENVKKL